MLTTLLPGLRELRSPVASGYIWLLAAWIALEPHIPKRREAAGLAATLYRLNDAFSNVGLAVAASVAAYLVGSLSMTLFSPRLRGLFRRSADLPDGPHRTEPLSTQGWFAVSQLARRSREQMEATLALSDTNVHEHVGALAEGGEMEIVRRAGYRRLLDRVRFTISRSRRRASLAGAVLRSDMPAPLPQDHFTQAELMRAVVGDLEQVLRTRLLGRDPELFSAVDRHRAEVEFRLAVIPPLLVLALVAGARLGLLATAALIAASLAASAGLFWDALSREREGNDILAGALTDGRVNSPTLGRWMAIASTIATQPKAEVLRQAAANAVNATSEVLAMLEGMDSNPARAYAARDALKDVRERISAVEGRFSPRVLIERTSALEQMDAAVNLWVQAFERPSRGSLIEQALVHTHEARAHLAAFRKAALEEIEQVGSESISSA